MNMIDETPEVTHVDGYDEEYREMGDCGVRVIHRYTKIMLMPTCTLEEDHDGPHDWDPDYVYLDDDEEDEA